MSARVEDLEPHTRMVCREFLIRWREMGEPEIRITHTMRTSDEQMHLYHQGRIIIGGNWVVVDHTKIVTNAKPGDSAHNYGAAFDVCFVGADPYLDEWEHKYGVISPLWQKLGEAGTKLGLNWGGPLGVNDKFAWDRPHFERSDWKSLRGTNG